MTDTGVDLPLAGIRVLDIATFIAAPYAAAIMGEFGAEVIKVEQPGVGDPWRRYGTPSARADSSLAWLSEARNKQSITLDLRQPEGAALLRRLVALSDVVCENFRPGTLERWGLGYDELAKDKPGLIMLRVSGYGQTGPYKDRPGFARIAHGFGGLSHLAGLPGGIPLTPGSTSLGDYMTGAYGAIGVLMALRVRERTGRGQVIDQALYESVFRALDELAPAYAAAGIVRDREGASTRNACPHGHYLCGDGLWVAIACTTDKMFERLSRAMGRPELAGPHRYGPVRHRLAERDRVEGLVSDWTGSMDRARLIEVCLAADVPIGPIYSIDEIFADPHYQARGTLHRVRDSEVGQVVVPGVIPHLSLTPGRIETLGPVLGSANDRVYGRLLGLTDGDMAALRAKKVI
ncbi:MAG: CoA transferase [Alphaproteobacteria bacterium]|nr:CoA transferase [Alphaproteobacteria bacterium]